MASPSDIRAGRAFVEVGADLTDLERGLRSARQKLEGFGAAVRSIGASFMAAGAVITAPLIAAAKVAASTGEEYVKMSQRTGMSVEALSALAYSAKTSDVALEEVEVGIKKMQKALFAAASGTQAASVAFARLGLSVNDLMKLSPEAQFDAVGQALLRISNPAERAYLAMELFGKTGTLLLPLLENLPQLRQEALRVGAVMSTEVARAATELEDEFKRIEWAALAVTRALGTAVLPVVKGFSETLLRGADFARGWIKEHQALARTAFSVGAAMTAVGTGVYGFGLAAKAVSASITTLSQTLQVLSAVNLAQGIGSIASVLKSVAFATVASKGTSAFAALGAALSSFGARLSGMGGLWAALKTGFGNALATMVGAAFAGFTKILGTIMLLPSYASAAFNTLRTAISALPGLVGVAIKSFDAFLSRSGLVVKAVEAISAAFSAGGLTGVFGMLASKVGAVFSAIGAAVTAASVPVLAFVAVLAAAIAAVGYDVKLILDTRAANKAIAETTQRCRELNEQLLQLDKASGGGNDMTFEKATESVDDYIQTLIEAGKTREEVTQALQQRRNAEAARQEATSKEWTPKNAFSEEVYTGIQNESAQLTAALDDALSKGLDGYNDLFSEVAENSRKLTQALAVEEAKRMGVMDKAIKERRKALQDFQNWQTEQQNTEKDRDAAEASRRLAQTDPMQAVKQASDAYATSLKDADSKVAAAQKLLEDALKNPETDVKRNARGEVEIVNNEEVQTAIDSAKQAYKVSEDQKEMLRNATQAALAAQKEAGDQTKDFAKRYREIATQRGNAEDERAFESHFTQARNSPNAMRQLEQNTQSDFESALERARQLKTQTETDYARAKESGKKSDLETAKADEEKTFTAESRVDVLRDRLLKIGAELDIPQRFDVAGTFNAAAAAEMGLGNSAADRTAKATEESARLLKWIRQKMDDNGLGFVAGV